VATIKREPKGEAMASYISGRRGLTSGLFYARHKSALAALCSPDKPVGYLDFRRDSALDAMAGAWHGAQSEHGVELTHMACSYHTLKRIVGNAMENNCPIESPHLSMPYMLQLPGCTEVNVVTDPSIRGTVRLLSPHDALFQYGDRSLGHRRLREGHEIGVVDTHRHVAMYEDAETGKKFSATFVVRKPDDQSPVFSGAVGEAPRTWGKRVMHFLEGLQRAGITKLAIERILEAQSQAPASMVCAPTPEAAHGRMRRRPDLLEASAPLAPLACA